MTAATADTTETMQGATRRPSRLRSVLVIVLVVLACLGVVVSGVAWWAHYTVFNTEGYMKIVGPVGEDPEVIARVSDYVAARVIEATDLQTRAAEALPPRLQLLAPAIADATDKLITKETQKVLSGEKAQELWVRINTFAHEKIVGLLRGENTYTYIAGSDVNLNTLPLISQALVAIDQRLPGGLSDRFSPPVIDPATPPDEAVQQLSSWLGRPLPADFGQVTLLQSDSLGPAQTAVKWFDRIVIILPIVTALLMAAAIWLSRRRLRTVIELSVGVVAALLLTRVLVGRLEAALIDRVSSDAVGVTKTVLSAAVEPLITFSTWLIIIGAVVAVIAFFVARRDVTDATTAAADRLLEKGGARAKPDAPLTRWVTAHKDLLRIAGLVVGLLLLLAASSGFAIILALGIILVYELIVSWLAGTWPYSPHAGADAPAVES
jgi:hypothetical protein